MFKEATHRNSFGKLLLSNLVYDQFTYVVHIFISDCTYQHFKDSQKCIMKNTFL